MRPRGAGADRRRGARRGARVSTPSRPARAEALASTRRAPVTTATAVAEQVAARRADLVAASRRARQPASHRHRLRTPGRPDAVGALWRDADTALQIGRAVHGALAVIDLSTGTDDAGRDAPETWPAGAPPPTAWAPTRDAVAAMVSAALASPDRGRRATGPALARALRRRPRRRRRPRGIRGPRRSRTDDGLVVVDYKTDRIDGPAGLDAAAARYGPQVASYALALEAATGRPVRRCVLVFVGDGTAVEVVLEGAELDEARRRGPPGRRRAPRRRRGARRRRSGNGRAREGRGRRAASPR